MCVDSSTTQDELMSFVKKNGKVIVKPSGGTYGKGIFMIDGVGDKRIQKLLNGGG